MDQDKTAGNQISGASWSLWSLELHHRLPTVLLLSRESVLTTVPLIWFGTVIRNLTFKQKTNLKNQSAPHPEVIKFHVVSPKKQVQKILYFVQFDIN